MPVGGQSGTESGSSHGLSLGLGATPARPGLWAAR